MTVGTRSRPTDCRATVASVEQVLDAAITEQAREWADLPCADELVQALRECTSGGKRLRPQFCHWGHVGATGEEPGPDTVRAAAALELLHTFAVVHDDVMDGSDDRRGAPSTHARQRARHSSNGWGGEPRRFAEGVAVLVGDVAYALAHRLVSGLGGSAQAIWHQMCSEMMLGQYLDLRGAASGERDISYATAVCRLKSARYTVVRPLLLGAASTARLAAVRETYTAYGEPLGEAFQQRDDLLGVFGDPAVTGKPAGDDLREGKPTVLLALTVQRAPASAGRLLDRVGRPGLTDTDIADIAQLCESTGARTTVTERVASAVEQACEALVGADLDPGAVEGLVEIAQAAAWRDR